jgi:transposase
MGDCRHARPASSWRSSTASTSGRVAFGAWQRTRSPTSSGTASARARRGMQIAVVATARKLAVLCWHLVVKGEDYAFQRPSLTEKKLRALELRAGLPSRRGQKGKAAAYSLKEVRRRENALAEQAEHAYRQLVSDWQTKRPPVRAGAGATNGERL